MSQRTDSAAGLSEQQLAAIRERISLIATPAPWDATPYCGVYNRPGDNIVLEDDEAEWTDLDFIAHAREDVPALLAEVERLRAVEAGARKLAAEWRTSAGEHAIYAVSKTLDETMRKLQSGRGESLSDCASELEAVLRGQDPDTWEHGVAVEITPAEAGAR